jgi:hypothetical protein
MRGGFVGIQVAVVLQSDAWPDLSCAALGAWVRIKASAELTGEAVGQRALERLGITAAELSELTEAGLLSKAGDRFEAAGMPEYRYPSDSTDARRERQAASRAGLTVAEWRARQEVTPLSGSPVNSTQLRSTQGDSPSRRVTSDTGRKATGETTKTEAAAVLSRLQQTTICGRCGQAGTDGNPLQTLANGTRHRFAPCPGAASVEAAL